MKHLIRNIAPSFLIDWYHFCLALLGAIVHRFPSRKLVVIGITGTNGKSTVVEMCDTILREAGFQVASVSSIRFRIADKEWPNMLKMTMPGRFGLQRFLRQAADAGCQYAVVEVTSEGIKQHRHMFINFQTAVFTNVTPEHIESHGGFEKYREAKAQLFRAARKTHIVNLDDRNADYFLQFPANEKYGYTVLQSEIHEGSATLTIRAEDVQALESGLKFRIRELNKNRDFNIDFSVPLLGEFHVSNALAAICVGLSQGIEVATIKRGLEKINSIPGRMEIVIREPFTVIVDYAHTPDAIQKVYRTIENWKLKMGDSRMICVLGSAGGGRDKWKRPEMGKIAARFCDSIILTNEDPYDENPVQILSDIESGISNFPSPISQILDRRHAIRKALEEAKPGDTVIITGKGCEPWICVSGGKKIPWDDREVVREEFKNVYPSA